MPAILAAVLSLGLLYLIVRTALTAGNPVLAAQLPPAERSALLRLRLDQLMVPGQSEVSPDLHRLASSAALGEPLAFEPFFVQAHAAERRGETRKAIALMEEARLRRRSFAPTRLALASYYARSGQLTETLVELEVLLRLRPDAVEPVVSELVNMLGSAAGRTVLARALVLDPPWRELFFNEARGSSVSPADALALLEAVRALQPDAEHREERELFVASLIEAGQVRRARQLWLAMLPERQRASSALMANAAFKGEPLGVPFGWTLASNDVASVDIAGRDTPQPYLDIHYFGRADSRLASQLLALPPGGYRLRYLYAGDAVVPSSQLYWNLECFDGGPDLLRSEITSLDSSFRQREERFVVPAAGCDGQRLSLVAQPGDIPELVNLRIAGLEIAR